MRLLLLSMASLLAGCATSTAKLYDEKGAIDHQAWSGSQLAQEFAFRGVDNLTELRAVLMNVNGNEKPHVHRTHDLILVVASGAAVVNFRDHRVTARAGDTVIVRRGVVHWIEKAGDQGAVINIIAAPAEWNDDQFPAE